MRKYHWFFIIAFVLCSCEHYTINNHYRVIAHRGYWKMANGADNSIQSLEEAVSLGVDGVELDICKTKDDSLVVIHGMYHGDYYIPETDYNVLKKIRLSNGEELPTFSDYLDKAKEYNIIYFLDLKNIQEDSNLLQIIYQYGCQYKVKICGTPEICERIKRKDSNISIVSVYYNEMSDLKDKGYSCLDFDIKEWKKNPERLDEAKKLGLEVAAWIVKSESDLIWCSTHGIDYLITDNPLEAIQFRSNYE